VERAEAEAILDGDRETAVALLLRIGELVEANERLEARVAELERRLKLELAELVASAVAGSAVSPVAWAREAVGSGAWWPVRTRG
jgi:hypothetical protein